MKKLFKVSFVGYYGDDVYILANGYDEASENAISIREKEEMKKEIKVF